MRNELNGVVVVDKPAGITSAKVVAELKKALGAAKVGHTGTLDPFATGVMVCCVGQATRLARFFLHSDKQYEAVLRLGITTDTLDATGRVLETNDLPDITEQALRSVFDRFVGRQMQKPPAFSALKHHGTPLYKLARQGKPVQKAARSVAITALRIQSVTLPEVRFDMHCSAGTYVRVLCDDIGRQLGCGGHLAELRRTAGCGFTIEEAIPLEALKAMGREAASRILIPMADALRGMAAFEADSDLLRHLAHGRRLDGSHIPIQAVEGGQAGPMNGYLKVVDGQNRLHAVLQWSPGGNTYNYCCVFN